MSELYVDLTKDPIPLDAGTVTGWKEVPLQPDDEPIVPLGFLSPRYPHLFTDAIYFGERDSSPYFAEPLRGSLITHFTRLSVAEALSKAQDMLPKTMRLVTFDAYRTLEVQQALYSTYLDALNNVYPNWPAEKLSAETQKYVSIPSFHPQRPSPHNTGGSVDLAIISIPEHLADQMTSTDAAGHAHGEGHDLLARHAELLPFGTPFDHGGPEAALAYYEQLATIRPLTPVEQHAQRNRRLLYRVMVEAGMVPYEEEWWHFNAPKSQMGARADGRDKASFGAVQLTDEQLHHEYTRRKLHTDQLLNYTQGIIAPDPRATSIGRAAIITPTGY